MVEQEPTEIVVEQSSIIQEMLAEAAQGNLIDITGQQKQQNSSPQQLEEQQEVLEEDVVEEIISTEEGDECCIVYDEQVIEEEIYVNNEENQENIAANSEANIDEKSSSFPFATEEIGQSETSEDLNEQREEEGNNSSENQGVQENSLLASLVGDNANSLPSVGCGAESDKDHFETKVLEENCEKMDSEDSLSEPAIAEDLPNASGSDATMVNTEIISEDELPLPTKPEINDAEEVSDEELPAPQRAELPPDAEVISEDELPVSTAIGDKHSPSPSRSDDQTDSTTRKKRRAESLDVSEEKKLESDSSKKDEQYNPMSPTSESNDSAPLEKKAKIEGK